MQDHSDTLTEFFRTLESHGDKAAIVESHENGAKLLTYETLAIDAARHAHALRASGLQRGDYVVLFANGGPDWITAFLATIAAGAAPIPLDTQTDSETLRHILDDSGASWAVVDGPRAEALDEAGFTGKRLHLYAENDDSVERFSDLKSQEPVTARPEFSPDDTVVLFYTSGTTGPPKGVPLTQRNVAFQLHAVIAAGLVDADDRILQPLPPHHVYPLIVGTLAPLALGITIVIPEAMLGPQIVAALRAENVSFIIGVPRLYEALVAAVESRIAGQKGLAGAYLRTALRLSTWLRKRLGWRFGKGLLLPLHHRMAPKLKVLASGGAALDPVIALKIEALGWQVASGYGLTETSPLLTINPPGKGRLASVGRAVPGIELRIDTSVAGADDAEGDSRTESDAAGGVHDAAGKPVGEEPRGDEGEILAHGDGVFGGYLNHDKDANAFTADGWFRTADLGRIDAEGYVYITGRRNTLLVTSAGKNIQPDELEQRYAEHELIDEIGLLMDDRQLAAVVVPDMARLAKQNVSAENGVRMALAQSGRDLASYKRVARHVLSRDPLPRTRLGKIQRHKLAELYADLKANPEHKAPRSLPIPIEEMARSDQQRLENSRAAEVWALLSERYPEHGLTPDSSVQMDLGVDSLGWLELGAEIGQRAGVALDEEQIAGIETVRDLLDAAAAGVGGSARDETPVAHPDSYLNDDQRRWLKPLSPTSRHIANSLYAVHGGTIRALFKLRTAGLENVPADRQCIIAPNHASFLDPSIIAAALPKEALEKTYWAGWTGYAFRNFFFRRISRLAQVVPIDPARAATSSLAFAAAVLDRGKNLVLFPEGERSATGDLLPLKPGIGLLTAHFKRVLIIPTWISGSLEAWPRDRSLPRLSEVSVTFGQPLDPREIIANSSADNAASAVTAELRTALEALRG